MHLSKASPRWQGGDKVLGVAHQLPKALPGLIPLQTSACFTGSSARLDQHVPAEQAQQPQPTGADMGLSRVSTG